MEVLVTGATGLLGRHLITALQERGDRVRALVLPSDDAGWLESREVATFRGDICQPETLAAPLRGVDTVFNLAAMIGLWRPMADYYAVNVAGAEHVGRAVLSAGVRRLVHISSWTVYGMGRGVFVPETFPFDPFPEPYAITKTASDRVMQQLIAREGVPAVIVRPGTFFGPGDRLHFERMADRVRGATGIVIGRGDNPLPFVYVTDVVQGLLLAADSPNAVGRAYNISNDQPMTQEGFLRAIAEEFGVEPPAIHVPYAALYSAAAAAERVADLTHTKPVVTRLGVKLFGSDNRHSIDRARAELGYEPRVSIREGVHLAAEWYRSRIETRPPVAARAA